MMIIFSFKKNPSTFIAASFFRSRKPGELLRSGPFTYRVTGAFCFLLCAKRYKLNDFLKKEEKPFQWPSNVTFLDLTCN